MQALLLATLLAAIDPAAARPAFEELDAMCRADAARLWGVGICGPILFADPATRDAVLYENGSITTAKLPLSVGIANTALTWEGKEWTMVMWPLPKNDFARRMLLGHESFHRVQQRLGFPSTGPSNQHLDDAVGRYWLRLEWRALSKALATGSKQAVADALAFRAKRRALIASAANDERSLEMHEGLAQYTGSALAQPDVKKRAADVIQLLASGDKEQSLMRSFAYTAGPAWGAVLEAKDKTWTRRVKASDDFGALAQRAWRIAPARDVDARARAYDGVTLLAEETARAERIAKERAVLRARFIDGPTVTLPLEKASMTFDPNRVQPLEGHGTVYQTITLSDAWGRIEVTNGALVSNDWKRMIVPAGEGKLTLNEGWRIDGGKVVRLPAE
jgi:hypothetical protein